MPAILEADKNQVFYRLLKHVRNDDLAALNEVLEHDQDPGSFWLNIALTMAVSDRKSAIIERLLQDERVNPNCSFRTACVTGQIDIVSRFLQNPRLDPAFEEDISLRYACLHGRVDVVKLLLQDPRVDPDGDHLPMIMCGAIDEGCMAVADVLMADRRFPTNATHGMFCLDAAIRSNCLTFVQQMLRLWPAIDSSVMASCVVMAIQCNHIAILECLLNETALPDDAYFLPIAISIRKQIWLAVALIISRIRDVRALKDAFLGQRYFANIPLRLRYVIWVPAVRRQCDRSWTHDGVFYDQFLRHERLIDYISCHFTDAPPGIHKWFPNGGPGYHEQLQELAALNERMSYMWKE